MNSQYEIVIVGAGPAGALCAWQLGLSGKKVLLLDTRKKTERKICGEYLCPKGVEILQDLGVLSELTQSFESLYGINLYSAKGTEVVSHFPGKERQSFGLSVNREKFDQFLLDKAIKAGVHFHAGESLRSIQFAGDFCEVTTNQGHYKCRLLVGADGRLSKVARLTGLHVPANERHRVAIHAFVRSRSPVERQGEMHFFSDGSYMGVNPVRQDEINFSLVCDGSKVKAWGGLVGTMNHYLSTSENLMSRFTLIDKEERLTAASPISHKVRDIIYRSSALIGDAAGLVDPLTGEGIYNALLSGRLLAQEIQSLKNWNELPSALKAYRKKYRRFLNEKNRLNHIFQLIIKRPRIVEGIAKYLLRRPTRADTFIGIIGNIYTPTQGLVQMWRKG